MSVISGIAAFLSESLHSASFSGSAPRNWHLYDLRHDIGKQELPCAALYISQDKMHTNCGEVWHESRINCDCYYSVPGKIKDLMETNWSGMTNVAGELIKAMWRETVSSTITGSIRDTISGLDGIVPESVRYSYYQTKVDSTPFFGFSIPININWKETEEASSETLETIYAVQIYAASGSFVTGSISEISASLA